jgi:hypothetical protein
MYSNTRFGDFPHYLPTEKWSDKNDLIIGWMLLSYRKNATASSTFEEFTPDNLTDENPRTFWIAENNNPGEWIVVDLKKVKSVRALQINFTDYKNNIYKSDSTVYTQFKIYSSTDNNNWKLIADLTTEKRDRPNAYIELTEEIKAQYIKYEHVYVASKYLAISDIRIFGNDDSPLPETPKTFSVKRDDDRRNAFIAWSEVKDAVGYNILWGIKPDKLYQTYQVFADKETKLELRALTLNQDYYFAIEAFNESGVSQLSETIYCK